MSMARVSTQMNYQDGKGNNVSRPCAAGMPQRSLQGPYLRRVCIVVGLTVCRGVAKHNSRVKMSESRSETDIQVRLEHLRVSEIS